MTSSVRPYQATSAAGGSYPEHGHRNPDARSGDLVRHDETADDLRLVGPVVERSSLDVEGVSAHFVAQVFRLRHARGGDIVDCAVFDNVHSETPIRNNTPLREACDACLGGCTIENLSCPLKAGFTQRHLSVHAYEFGAGRVSATAEKSNVPLRHHINFDAVSLPIFVTSQSREWISASGGALS